MGKSAEVMPPLPEPHATVDIWGHDCPHYTREQMRAYALAAMAAERERCAKLCEEKADLMCHDGTPLSVQLNWQQACEYVAAGIRASASSD